MFAVANYRGKKLSELWDKAEQAADAMAYVQRTFQVEMEGAKLVRRVPAFNYMELLKPRGNAWAKDLLAGISREEALPRDGDGDGAGDDSGSGAEEAVPF
jgi:hypothetical protein